MYFSNFIVLSLLALASSVVSQVVVTVTSTVTVITVTVTPPSTSTSTVVVTVSGTPSTASSKYTSTRTVTVTATPPATTAAASCPLGLGGSCGLWNPAANGCRSCASGLTCRSIMWSSSRCETAAKTVVTLTSTIWAP